MLIEVSVKVPTKAIKEINIMRAPVLIKKVIKNKAMTTTLDMNGRTLKQACTHIK